MAISREGVLAAIRAIGLPASGLDFVRQALEGPSRSVGGSGYLNMTSHYPSRATGETRQTESATAERLFVLDREYELGRSPGRNELLTYLDQCPAVTLEGKRHDGRRCRTPYRADFLGIHRASVTAYQIKTEERLKELVKAKDGDWYLDDHGYRHRPADQAFESLGIKHRVVSTSQLSQIRGENIQLLLAARNMANSRTGGRLERRVRRQLRRTPVLSLSELADCARITDLSPLLRLVDEGVLVTDLARYRLSFPGNAFLALDAFTLDALGRAETFTANNLQTLDESVPRTKGLLRIISRLDALSGQSRCPQKSARTLRRYKATLRVGKAADLAGSFHNCGRSGSRLHKTHDALINRTLLKWFANPDRPSLSSVFRTYLNRFEVMQKAKRRHKRPFDRNAVVFQTFATRLRKLGQSDVAARRGGRRARNAALSPTPADARALPATRPFQIAHLDHFLADQYVAVARSEGTFFRCKPWITLLIDGYTKEIIGISVSLGNPSRRSCARVLRDCVRRHGRLPEGIVTDAGTEFRSNFYHSFLAAAVVEKFERPVTAGKWGSEVERAYGGYKDEYLASQPGNTRDPDSHRSVSRGFRSIDRANLDLVAFWQRIGRFVAWFNAHPRGTRTKAPTIARSEGLRQFSCSGVLTPYDEPFLIATSISASAKEYKFDPQRGIRTQDRHYWAPGMAGWAKRHLSDVRCDPEDDAFVYVHLKNCWHIAKSSAVRSRLAAGYDATLCETLKLQEGKEALNAAKRKRDVELGRLQLADARERLPEQRAAPIAIAPPPEPRARSRGCTRTRRHLSRNARLHWARGS